MRWPIDLSGRTHATRPDPDLHQNQASDRNAADRISPTARAVFSVPEIESPSSGRRELVDDRIVPKAEYQFAEMPARYRPLNSWDATQWIDGGDPQSSPSIHLDRITLPSLAAENPNTGMQRKRASTTVSFLAAELRELGCRSGPVRVGRQTTHRIRRRFTPPATGLPWNLTLADAAEAVWDGESGRSQVAITDLGKVPAGRAPATVE